MRSLAILFLALALFVPAFAADIDGKWSAQLDSPNGPINLIYNFKADGATLTGEMAGPDNMPIKIANGKIEGNNISFSVTINFGQEFTMQYKGVMSGTEIKMSSDFGGQAFEFTLKKG